MARLKSRTQYEKPRGAPAYMVTLANVCLLLLVFFVCFFYVGNDTGAPKSKSALQSFRRGYLAAPGGVSVLRPDEVKLAPSRAASKKEPAMSKSRGNNIMRQLRETMDTLKQQHSDISALFDIQLTGQGLKLRLPDAALFPSGQAELTGDVKQSLARIAQISKENSLDVTVEGHTDAHPISTTQYPSNWELSAARATAVVRYMSQAAGIDPRTMTAIGRGEFSPNCDTTEDPSDQCYARNRRIEILLQPPGASKGAPSAQSVDKLFGGGGAVWDQ